MDGKGTVTTLMDEFARDTGVSSASDGTPPRRYLWTDAFAVCNYVGLHRRTREERHLANARQLVDQVHAILGRHRPDDARQGWISNLDEETGAEHPTRGGLRIGKGLPERGPGEPYDERLEWDRDGQYYHYLTKWMHALDVAGRATGNPDCHRWALELAAAAHAGFAWSPGPGSPKRLHWKMSIDLSRPLVASMGQHDALDGWITCRQVQAGAARAFGGLPSDPDLTHPMAELAAMSKRMDRRTIDPLGIGGLLADASRIAQLAVSTDWREGARQLAGILEDAGEGLQVVRNAGTLAGPPTHRLAFRELGLAIGLRGLEPVRTCLRNDGDAFPDAARLERILSRLEPFVPLGEELARFWCEPGNREVESWLAHGDINLVMLATALEPNGFLSLA